MYSLEILLLDTENKKDDSFRVHSMFSFLYYNSSFFVDNAVNISAKHNYVNSELENKTFELIGFILSCQSSRRYI